MQADDDDESSDGEWVAASEDEAAIDADDAGQCLSVLRVGIGLE